MNSKNETICHSQITLVVRTLTIDGVVFEDRRRAIKRIGEETWTFFKWVKEMGNRYRTIVNERACNGKKMDFDNGTENDSGFDEKWSKNWHPKLTDEELFKMSGQPLLPFGV